MTTSDVDKREKVSFFGYFIIALILLWIINFVVFAYLSEHFGGSALNGKIEAEHYFLGSHGQYREVSREFFLFSRIQEIVTLILHFSLMSIAVIWTLKDRRSKK